MKHPGIGGNTLSECGARVFNFCAISMLCVASVFCGAQTRSKTASHRQADAREKKTTTPSLPSNTAALPAKISLHNGKLTINANNSDLDQTLLNVAEISGMTIHGLEKSTRIFGVYGPGNPSDVLSHLLVGSDYNFIMAGSMHNGAPRELLLTAKSDAAPANAPANPHPSAAETPSTSETSSAPEATNDAQPSEAQPAENAPNTPAAENDRDSQDGDQAAYERLEQRLLRLQHMHDKQEEQEGPK